MKTLMKSILGVGAVMMLTSCSLFESPLDIPSDWERLEVSEPVQVDMMAFEDDVDPYGEDYGHEGHGHDEFGQEHGSERSDSGATQDDYLEYQGMPYTHVEEGGIVFYNGGSSTCPPTIDKAIYNESLDVVEVTIKQYSDTPCTADLNYFKQRITRVDDQTFTQGTQVSILDSQSSSI